MFVQDMPGVLFMLLAEDWLLKGCGRGLAFQGTPCHLGGGNIEWSRQEGGEDVLAAEGQAARGSCDV